MLASRSLLDTKELMQTLKDTSTTYSSLLINEGHVLWTLAFIVYCFLVMKLVNQMRDVNGFKGKQKRDIDSK